MTDREKAIVMAYTGYCMLAGDKLKVFYEYVGELLGRPVYTHEFADPDIQEKASDDFYKLCRETTPDVNNVEVVRCNDCKWNHIHVTPKGHDYHICRLLNLAFDNDDDFFCAYGEKRNECGEPIPHWRGQMDGCLPFQEEEQDGSINQ